MWSLQVPEEDMNPVRSQEAAPKHDGRQHSVVRRGLIIPGDWSDGLERQGSNPWSTTKQYALLDKLVKSSLSKGEVLPVRIRGRVPAAFGEMDIIFVFETKGVGSIPARPAK